PRALGRAQEPRIPPYTALYQSVIHQAPASARLDSKPPARPHEAPLLRRSHHGRLHTGDQGRRHPLPEGRTPCPGRLVGAEEPGSTRQDARQEAVKREACSSARLEDRKSVV